MVTVKHRRESRAMEFKDSSSDIGISRKASPLIGERFRQLRSSETRSYFGAGLGLYTATTFTDLPGAERECRNRAGQRLDLHPHLPPEFLPVDRERLAL